MFSGAIERPVALKRLIKMFHVGSRNKRKCFTSRDTAVFM